MVLKIPGFRLIDYIGHLKHGLATYENQNMVERIVEPVADNKHIVGIRVENLIIYNLYKPTSINWSYSTLPIQKY